VLSVLWLHELLDEHRDLRAFIGGLASSTSLKTNAIRSKSATFAALSLAARYVRAGAQYSFSRSTKAASTAFVPVCAR
jgi:hypothetical protein